MPPEAFVGVVLAAQRPGRIDPLAEAHGITHKCLLPIGGAALIAHPVAALLATPGIAGVRIVVEPAMNDAIRAVLPADAPITFIAAADNLADSVIAATHGLDGRIVVTTADNVLLTAPAVAQLVAALGGADAAVAMANKASVLAAHPEGQRRFYRLTDDEYSNCNLYGFANRKALAAAETFRSGGQFAKKPMRLVAAVGLINVALFFMGRLSLRGALSRMSRRFGVQVVPVVLADGSHAIDVDNERTYRVATLLMEQRIAKTARAEGQLAPA